MRWGWLTKQEFLSGCAGRVWGLEKAVFRRRE